MTYGNGLQIKYVYDALDRISEVQYNIGEGGAFETVYAYTYDAGGRLFSVTDERANEVTVYQYDLRGNLLQSVVYDSAEYKNLYQTRVEYDEKMRVSSMYATFDYVGTTGQKAHQLRQSYTYNFKNQLVVLKLSDNNNRLNGTLEYLYDEYGRRSERSTLVYDGDAYAFQRREAFTYYAEGDIGSYRVASYSSRVSSTSYDALVYHYTYDANGNITQIKDGNNALLCRYTYDTMGQMIREDNAVLNKTYVYAYDVGGNILSKTTYAYTTGLLGIAQQTKTYTYGDPTWGDLLTNWNGYAITYDTIGNPLQWKGASLTWQGRKLQSYTSTGKALSFTYNADGIRTSKTVNGVTHEYILSGSQIVMEHWGDNVLMYLYNESGAPIGFGYRNSTYYEGYFDYYFYDTNLQGDIVGLYNESWRCIGTYTYDAWGNCTVTATSGISTTDTNVLTNINPFRYRGYYYDVETGLYYLQSRYYDPEIGRFINADGQLNLGSHMLGANLFVYCVNNPVNLIDLDGNEPGDLFDTIDEAMICFARMHKCFIVPVKTELDFSFSIKRHLMR